MASTVNYDDNLFHIMAITRTLRSGLQLDIDAQLYLDRVVEDLLFIDATLERVHEELRDSRYLINRRGHLRQLMRAKRAYSDLLGEILNGQTAFRVELSRIRSKLEAAHDQQQRDIDEIRDDMEQVGGEDDQHTIVSQDEFRFLLQNDEEQE